MEVGGKGDGGLEKEAHPRHFGTGMEGSNAGPSNVICQMSYVVELGLGVFLFLSETSGGGQPSLTPRYVAISQLTCVGEIHRGKKWSGKEDVGSPFGMTSTVVRRPIALGIRRQRTGGVEELVAVAGDGDVLEGREDEALEGVPGGGRGRGRGRGGGARRVGGSTGHGPSWTALAGGSDHGDRKGCWVGLTGACPSPSSSCVMVEMDRGEEWLN